MEILDEGGNNTLGSSTAAEELRSGLTLFLYKNLCEEVSKAQSL